MFWIKFAHEASIVIGIVAVLAWVVVMIARCVCLFCGKVVKNCMKCHTSCPAQGWRINTTIVWMSMLLLLLFFTHSYTHPLLPVDSPSPLENCGCEDKPDRLPIHERRDGDETISINMTVDECRKMNALVLEKHPEITKVDLCD